MKRLLMAAGLTAALSVPVAVFATMGTAESSTAAQAQYAPTNTAAPTVSGTAQDGSTLTASNGTFASSSALTYSYQWQRCNSTGAACISIAGATNQTYVLQAADVGNRVRVVVTAHNTDGANSANSATTDVVTAKGTPPPTTGTTVSASSVALPDRLVIDQVKFTPNPVPTRQSITARFHVKETVGGKSVSDALVYSIGLPYSRVSVPGEVKTDANGWATVTYNPEKFFPQRGYITFFVRARKAGDDPLAGVSTRRLVQVTIR